MSISKSTPPIAALREAQSGFARVQLQALTSPNFNDLISMDDPHQVFTLSSEALRSGAGLDSAESVGWRFIVRPTEAQENNQQIPLEVSLVEVLSSGDKYKFSHQQRGLLAEATEKAFAAVEQIAEGGEYELRLLRAAGIARTDAIWLKNLRTEEDLILPIVSGIQGLAIGQVYRTEDFMEVLRVEADKTPFDNRPISSSR